MRVLVAEDERRVADAIGRGLRREGLGVDLAHDGRSALLKARAGGYDVLVLDRDLPELHGDDVCRAVAAELPRTRILMLTASARPRTWWRASRSAPTTTCASRSRSPSSWPA